MSDTPLVPAPLYGLRTWRVRGERGAELLAGPQKGSRWPRDGEWMRAVCLDRPEHDAPVPGCECGVHGLHPTRASARHVLASRFELPGIVEAAGRVELHADGFRAERARPYALLVRPGDNARLAERLAGAYGAEVVAIDGPDALLAFCHERGLGLEPAVVESLLGTERFAAAQAEKQRSAKLTRLRLAIVAALLALLIALGALLAGGTPDHPLAGRTGKVQPQR